MITLYYSDSLPTRKLATFTFDSSVLDLKVIEKIIFVLSQVSKPNPKKIISVLVVSDAFNSNVLNNATNMLADTLKKNLEQQARLLQLPTVNFEVECCDVKQINYRLGKSYDLVFQYYQTDLSFNAMAVGQGMINALGIFILGVSNKLSITLFMQWFYHQAGKVFSNKCGVNLQAQIIGDKGFELNNQLVHKTDMTEDYNADYCKADEATFTRIKAMLTEIYSSASNKLARPKLICLTGKRGRGKSTMAGKLMANLYLSQNQLLSESPNYATNSELEIFLVYDKSYHANQTVASYKKILDDKTGLKATNWQSFLAKANSNKISKNCLLVIEEAASIPNKVLLQLISKSKCSVLISTTEGYEGSGEGFSLGVLPYLEELSYQSKIDLAKFNLLTPRRYGTNDKLELLFDRLLGLDFSLVKFDSDACNFSSQVEVKIEPYEQINVYQDEHKLLNIFALLRLAHYQTSPNDFLAMLNGQNRLILTMAVDDKASENYAKYKRQIVGVIWLELEEVLESKVQAEVIAGNRRLAGLRISQTLLYDYGLKTSARIARVVRIAIHPQLQRQKLGSVLLETAETYLENTCGQEIIGVSFAEKYGIINFWRKLNYQLIKAGKKLGTASGKKSLVMLKQLKASKKHKVNEASYSLSYFRSIRQAVKLYEMQSLGFKAIELAKAKENYKFVESENKNQNNGKAIYRNLQELIIQNLQWLDAEQLAARVWLYAKTSRPLYLDLWLLMAFCLSWHPNRFGLAKSLDEFLLCLYDTDIVKVKYGLNWLVSKGHGQPNEARFKQELFSTINNLIAK